MNSVAKKRGTNKKPAGKPLPAGEIARAAKRAGLAVVAPSPRPPDWIVQDLKAVGGEISRAIDAMIGSRSEDKTIALEYFENALRLAHDARLGVDCAVKSLQELGGAS